MRFVRLAALAIACLIVVALLGWYVVIPNWRPGLQAGEQYGLDVSHHQDDIDWDAVATDGISFTYIKASEGGDFTDDRFAENWKEAQQAGIQTGAYHFFTLCTDGAKQARQFLRVAAPDPDALPPALDLEFGGNCSARPSRDDLPRGSWSVWQLHGYADVSGVSGGVDFNVARISELEATPRAEARQPTRRSSHASNVRTP